MIHVKKALLGVKEASEVPAWRRRGQTVESFGKREDHMRKMGEACRGMSWAIFFGRTASGCWSQKRCSELSAPLFSQLGILFGPRPGLRPTSMVSEYP